MVSTRWKLAVAFALCSLAVALTVQATTGSGGEGKEGEADASESTQSVAAVALAARMIHEGQASNSPEVLIAAVVLLHKNPLETPKGEAPAFDLKALLAEATAMRPKDKALADFIAKVSDDIKEESRGSTHPIAARKFSVKAGGTSVVGSQTFKAKATATAHVVQTPVRTTVKDSKGRPHTVLVEEPLILQVKAGGKVVASSGPSLAPHVQFKPANQVTVSIEIVNKGKVVAEGRLFTN